MVPTANEHTQINESGDKPVIAFIGAGNMAEAILGGLYASGHPSSRLRFSEPFEARRNYMKSKYPEVYSTADNNDAIQGANVIILAVKPQVLRTVVQGLDLAGRQVLVISIAAGIRTGDILRWLDAAGNVPLIRCMPNTPALIGEGAVGLYPTASVNDTHKKTAEDIMRAVSKQVAWVDNEALIDTVTAVSGSGPAYFFLIMEAMQDAAVAAGLSEADAKALTLQTCLGAGKMALESEDDLATLRQKVTSPNGTTEAAIKSMETANIRKIMEDALNAAESRGKEIAEEFGQD